MVAVFDLLDALFEDRGGVHAGVQRSTSESGRHITLDGDELCAQGRGSVCAVCVCQILREIKPMERMCVYVTESYMLNRVWMKRLCYEIESDVRALRWAGAG